MNKRVQSLLEMAIVIGGLAATPMFFIASFETVIAAVHTERVAATQLEGPSGSVLSPPRF